MADDLALVRSVRPVLLAGGTSLRVVGRLRVARGRGHILDHGGTLRRHDTGPRHDTRLRSSDAEDGKLGRRGNDLLGRHVRLGHDHGEKHVLIGLKALSGLSRDVLR